MSNTNKVKCTSWQVAVDIVVAVSAVVIVTAAIVVQIVAAVSAVIVVIVAVIQMTIRNFNCFSANTLMLKYMG
jgi:hypothetical protein